MGKTHEALQKAEREYHRSLQRIGFDADVPQATRPLAQAKTDLALEPYQGLKTNVLGPSPNGPIKVILVNGTSHGSGATTTAVNFATTMTKHSIAKVLLVDVNLRTPGLHDAFGIDQHEGLSNILMNSCRMQPEIKKVGPGELHVLTCGGSNLFGPHGLFESDEFDQFLKTAREQFDYVILDAPPVPVFSEFRILCRKVDGVILVIDAGRTRRKVALRAKKEIEDAGGNLLGVVLNRRKFYIPKWIYERI